MAITKPVMYTTVEDAEVAFNRPVSDEVMRKIIQNVNMLSELAKIGSVTAVAVNQVGVPSPNPDIHQQCDGTKIEQVNSPLQSSSGFDRFTPDLKKRFIRGAQDETTNNITAVDLTNNLSHAHDTGYVCTGIVGEEGDERHGYATLCHNHSINADLSEADPIDLEHVKVVMYLKIN